MKVLLLLASFLAVMFAVTFAHAEDDTRYRLGTSLSMPHDATTSSTTTNAISANMNTIRLLCSAACYVAIAASPIQAIATAATGAYLAAAVAEYFRVTPGQHVAVLAVTGTGTLYITELDH